MGFPRKHVKVVNPFKRYSSLKNITIHPMPNNLDPNFDFQKSIPEWVVNSEKTEIAREFIFENFDYAFAFMTLCAQYAKQLDHHPDWSNSWNKVSVRLSTHSAKALTQLDILLAKAMEDSYQQVLASK
jgi:4a-hydroxytetrahydrobiopterin dehydratase